MIHAVFLDRDGVLNEAVIRNGKPHPPASVEELRVVPNAAEALQKLKNAGFLLIVVTNQPDVARGNITHARVEAVNAALSKVLPLDEFRVCCHDDADRCECRKPLPGMLLAAAREHGIDLANSYLVGDRWRDIDAGAAAGCRTVLIDRGYGEPAPVNPPSHRTRDLEGAVRFILQTYCVSKP